MPGFVPGSGAKLKPDNMETIISNFHNRQMPELNGYFNWKAKNIQLIHKYGLRLITEYYWQRYLFGDQTAAEIFS